MRWMRWKKNFKRWKILCSPLKRLKKIFHRNQQNAVKNFSLLPAECGEKNFLTATSRMRLKKISPLKSQLWQIFTAYFNAYLKFTGNTIEVIDRWRSGIGSWSHTGGELFEPVYGSFFFVWNPVNAVKIFCRLYSQILQRFTALTAINAKRCERFAVKNFFHRYSPLI